MTDLIVKGHQETQFLHSGQILTVIYSGYNDYLTNLGQSLLKQRMRNKEIYKKLNYRSKKEGLSNLDQDHKQS